MKGLVLGFACVAAISSSAYAFDFSAANAAFADRETSDARIQEARGLYGAALTSTTGAEKVFAVEQLVRLDYFVGARSANNDEKKQSYGHCMDTVEAIKDTDGAPYYYWRAACLASWAKANGVLASLQRAPELAGLIKKGLGISQTYEGGGFYRVGSALYLNLPAIAGGDLNLADSYADKAIASAAYAGTPNPDTETGDYYYNAYGYKAQIVAKKGDKAKAITILEGAIARIDAGDLPVGREPETRLHRKELAEILASLR